MSKEQADIERSIERLHLTRVQQLLREREKLENEIREQARREVPPVYILELIKFQRIPDLFENEESTLMHLKLTEAQFYRVLQLMKLVDDPTYVKALSELDEVSEIAKVFIEKEMSYYKRVQEYSCGLIRTALEKTNGNRSHAARLLQMNRTTLVEMIKKYGIEAPAEPLTVINDAANEA